MEYKNLKRIVELISDNELNEFEMETEEFRLSVKRGPSSEAIPVVPNYSMPVPHMQNYPAAPPAPAAEPDLPAVAEEEDSGLVEISSPMVGTFYRSPSPDAPFYVTEGQEITPDTTVCIIEAMKVMNDIKAEVTGIIREVVAEDATPVEYGQPLFRVEPR